MVFDPGLLTLGVGGVLGYIIKPGKNGEQIMTPILPDKEKLQATKPFVYKRITLDMATARTNQEFIENADQIIIINRSASVACNIRINEVEYGILDLRDFEQFTGLIWRFFITNAAGTGSIDLLICRGGTFFGTPLRGELPGAGGGGGVGGAFYTLRSVMGTHFTEAILQNATEEEDITGLVSNKIRITGVIVQSDQQLDWRLIFFRTDGFADTTLDDDTFAGEVEVDMPSYGFQIAGAGQYYMSVEGLDLDYEDEDGTSELHVALQNLSATAKNAGATGQIVVSFIYQQRD